MLRMYDYMTKFVQHMRGKFNRTELSVFDASRRRLVGEVKCTGRVLLRLEDGRSVEVDRLTDSLLLKDCPHNFTRRESTLCFLGLFTFYA